MTLLTSETPLSLWHAIIQEAEAKCHCQLKQEVESYLVFLLMRYLKRPDFIGHIMASDYLQGLTLRSMQRFTALQEVGDKCLLFSGLFPNLAEKRLVKISYFVGLGQTAYATISYTGNTLFELLSQQFVHLMDILQCIPAHPTRLLPLAAYDLWNETNSQQALVQLKHYTYSIPVKK